MPPRRDHAEDPEHRERDQREWREGIHHVRDGAATLFRRQAASRYRGEAGDDQHEERSDPEAGEEPVHRVDQPQPLSEERSAQRAGNHAGCRE